MSEAKHTEEALCLFAAGPTLECLMSEDGGNRWNTKQE